MGSLVAFTTGEFFFTLILLVCSPRQIRKTIIQPIIIQMLSLFLWIKRLTYECKQNKTVNTHPFPGATFPHVDTDTVIRLAVPRKVEDFFE
jgi:hypothetical protein